MNCSNCDCKDAPQAIRFLCISYIPARPGVQYRCRCCGHVWDEYADELTQVLPGDEVDTP